MKNILWLLLLVALMLPAFMVNARNWAEADRSSAGIAPTPEAEKRAVVQVYAARAYGWRRPYAVHCWIATKAENAKTYTVYQVVGWNLRRNLPAVSIQADLPDRSWYDNRPEILQDVRGQDAAAMIPLIDKAAREYHDQYAYLAVPGPNSNSFVSSIIRQTPGLTVELPPHAIGKDWLGGWRMFARSESKTGFQFSLFGLFGITVGRAEGFEINILSAVFGFDVLRPALKLPLIGRVGMKDAPLKHE